MPSMPPYNWHDFVPEMIRSYGSRVVAEVGVWKGQLSDAILSTCPSVELLYLVDAWEVVIANLDDGRTVTACAGQTQQEYDDAYQTACYTVGKFHGRTKILKRPSVEAAQSISDGSLDAVIIDALHFMPYVAQDIAAWWPKLRRGGVMLGDDFGGYYPGVEVGVRQMFGEDFRVWGLAERATWWVEKEDQCLGNG